MSSIFTRRPFSNRPVTALTLAISPIVAGLLAPSPAPKPQAKAKPVKKASRLTKPQQTTLTAIEGHWSNTGDDARMPYSPSLLATLKALAGKNLLTYVRSGDEFIISAPQAKAA